MQQKKEQIPAAGRGEEGPDTYPALLLSSFQALDRPVLGWALLCRRGRGTQSHMPTEEREGQDRNRKGLM